LHLIAEKADGALRDALSLFDLVLTYSSDNAVTYRDTAENLHILDYDYYFKLTDHFIAKDLSGALLTFNEILKKGFDGQNFIVGLAEHFRDLLVCKDKATIDLLEVSEGIKKKYLEQSKAISKSFLLSALNITNQSDLNFKSSNNQRLHVEIHADETDSPEFSPETDGNS
jgi:DNA polymerase III subunit gamma/tau